MAATKSKKNNIADDSGLLEQLIESLLKKGMVRLTHFGLFEVVEVRGRMRYAFGKRKMVPVKAFRKIRFTPAAGLRDMLNGKGRSIKNKKQ